VVVRERRGKKGGETRNLMTRQTRQDKTSCLGAKYHLFYFIFCTPIDRIISHPNKHFHWLLLPPHLRDVKQFRVTSPSGPRIVLVRIARLQLRSTPVAKVLLALGAGHLSVSRQSAYYASSAMQIFLRDCIPSTFPREHGNSDMTSYSFPAILGSLDLLRISPPAFPGSVSRTVAP
jgi:hypothetical protein